MNSRQKIVSRLLALFLFFISVNSHAEQEAVFLPAAQAFSYQTEFTKDTVDVHWKISEGYFLYKSRITAIQNNHPLHIVFSGDEIDKEDEFLGKLTIFKHHLSISLAAKNDLPITLTFQGCAEQGFCYPPVSVSITPQNIAQKTSLTSAGSAISDQDYITNLLRSDSLLWKLSLFFILGIGLAFTPCVFPMFPILSSIIVGQGKQLSTKKAFVLSLGYVLGMAFTYAIAGVVVGYFGASANIQLYLQTPWVLVVFSLLFIALAFSMFGFYELALPRSLQDKLQTVNNATKSGQIPSVMVMGAISALVVSPCVSAPLAGVLAYISATGDASLGGVALLALALGMGAPLLIIGTGGGRFLPKSGAWMNTIKHLFGVALLAVAVWLLSRIVSSDVSLLLWSTLLFVSGVYLGAFEQGTKKWSRFYKAIGLLMCIYAVLFIVTIFNQHDNKLPFQSGKTLASNPIQTPQRPRISSQSEFQNALQAAQTQNKILIVDFYADWCISCKIMEKEIFDQAEVQSLLQDYQFVQLDITQNTKAQRALLDQFNLFGPPAVLFFKQGQHLKSQQLVGEFSKATFINRLNTLKEI